MRDIPTIQEFDATLRYYGLGPLSGKAERMGGASDKANFALNTSQGRYFCRVRRSYSDRDGLIHRVVSHLTDRGFPTAPLLHSITGETYVQYNNRTYELFPFLHGEGFEKGNQAQFAAMGKAIAQFHDCMQDFESPIPLDRNFFNNYPDSSHQRRFIQTTERDVANIEGTPDLKESIAKALIKIRRKMEQVTSLWENIEPDLPSTFVHGDYHLYNVQFKGNEVAYVCDFDFVMPAERIYDIITAFVWWLRGTVTEGMEESPPDISYLKPYREFLAEYNKQSSRMLTSEEMRALIPDMQRQLLLYGIRASAMRSESIEGMLEWIKNHIKLAEWLGRYRAEFERAFFQ